MRRDGDELNSSPPVVAVPSSPLRIAVSAVLHRPAATVVLVRAGWRLRRRGWWRQAPFLPVPGASYWNFRRVTAAGELGELSLNELVAAARWSVRKPSRTDG